MIRHPMNQKTILWIAGVSAVLYTAIIFWFGMAMGTRYNLRQLAVVLDDTQAQLAFNRLLEERKLELLLSRGCVTAALQKTRISIDQDMKLLASFSEGGLGRGTVKYINDRDPDFLDALKGFKSKYVDSWIEPECPTKQSQRPGPLGNLPGTR